MNFLRAALALLVALVAGGLSVASGTCSNSLVLLEPLHGNLPTSSWNSTTPSAQMSTCAVM